MGQIYQPRDPSVAYQASQPNPNPVTLQAIDSSSKIAELGRQAGNYLGNYSQQALREQEFQATALSRANEVNLQNTRNSIAAFQASQQGDLAKMELSGRAALANTELYNNSQARANQLQLSQTELNNQLQLRNAAYLANNVTNLGQALVGFSETLWNKRVEQMDRENEALRVQGLTDYLNGKVGNAKADIAKVNSIETGRVIESGKANAAADSFEAAGRPNEAALIRANNPFYLQGIQEATAIKAGLGYGTYLTNKIEAANLNRLDPGYQQKLLGLLDIASKEYIKEQSLDQVNPAILAKYFGFEKAQTEAAIIARYNNQANKEVKDAQLVSSESLAFNNYRPILNLPVNQQAAEILKIVSLATQANGGNPIDGQQSVLKQFVKAAQQDGNFSLVDRFVNMDRGDGKPYGATPGMQEIYVTTKRQFEQGQAAQLKQYQDDQLKSTVANYKLAFASGDPDQIRQAQQASVRSLMQIGTPEAKLAAAEILNDNAGDAPAIKHALELADDKGYLTKQFLDANRSKMTKSTYEMWAKRLDQTSKLKTDPAFKSVLDSMELKIMGAAVEGNKEQKDPWVTKASNEFAKMQTKKFNDFAKDWLAQNPGATAKDFQDWAKSLEASYTNPTQFRVDPSTNLPAGMRSMAPELSTQKLVTRIPIGNGKVAEDYRHPKIQQALRTGAMPLKSVNFATDFVLTKEQAQEAVVQAEKTGVWPSYVTDLTSRTGKDAKTIVQAQARLYGGSGVIVLPGNYQLPVSSLGVTYVDKDTAQSFAKSNGFSHKGAIAYSTMIQDESGGDPMNIGDNGNASGLFQWNKQVSPDRVMRLNRFAKAQGKPPTDPAVQLQYSMYEMKNYYPDSWRIFTSPNPTTNQLWRATVNYLGFSPRVYAQRQASLEANLR
jgi:hypothetical protein